MTTKSDNPSDYDFSIRGLSCIRNAGFDSMEMMARYIKRFGLQHLVKHHNFGTMSANEISSVLIENGFL